MRQWNNKCDLQERTTQINAAFVNFTHLRIHFSFWPHFCCQSFSQLQKKKIKLELTFIHSINCDHEKVQFDILYLWSTYNHHQNCPAMVRHDHLGLVRAIVHSAVFRLDFCPPPLSLYVQCLQMSTLSASSMTLPSSLIDSQ